MEGAVLSGVKEWYKVRHDKEKDVLKIVYWVLNKPNNYCIICTQSPTEIESQLIWNALKQEFAISRINRLKIKCLLTFKSLEFRAKYKLMMTDGDYDGLC